MRSKEQLAFVVIIAIVIGIVQSRTKYTVHTARESFNGKELTSWDEAYAYCKKIYSGGQLATFKTLQNSRKVHTALYKRSYERNDCKMMTRLTMIVKYSRRSTVAKLLIACLAWG